MISRGFFGFLISAVLISGAVYIGVVKLKEDISVNPSPTPTPEGVKFNIMSSPTPQATNSTQGVKEIVRKYSQLPGILKEDILQNKKAVIVTSKGNIEFEIYPEASKAASNFIYLAANQFYDGLIFHRVVPGFVIQGGDPLGNGSGGPGYSFEDEPVTRPYLRGTVAMANAGPNTNGSQFFIVLQDQPTLPPNYTIFGQVTSGMDVVDKIVVGDIMRQIVIQNLK